MSGSAALSAAIRRRGGVPEPSSRPTSSPSNPNQNQLMNDRRNIGIVNRNPYIANQQQNVKKVENNTNFDNNFNKMIMGNLMNKMTQIESILNQNNQLSFKLDNVNNNFSNLQMKFNNLSINKDDISKQLNALTVKNEEFQNVVNFLVDKISSLEKKIDELSEKKIILNENEIKTDNESISVSETITSDENQDESIIMSNEINQLDHITENQATENQATENILDKKEDDTVKEMIENKEEIKPEKSSKKGKKEYSNKNRVKLSIDN